MLILSMNMLVCTGINFAKLQLISKSRLFPTLNYIKVSVLWLFQKIKRGTRGKYGRKTLNLGRSNHIKT